jgi:predicted Zn-dependent protease with MMP-like domain
MRQRCGQFAQPGRTVDPQQFMVPVRVDDATFAQAVDAAIDNLPRSIREYVQDVPVLVEDYPSDDLMDEESVSPQILGIYIGTPRTEAGPTHQPLTRVILFKKNLEKICRDRDELIDQIQITLRHEIGHHLGLSEEDMESWARVGRVRLSRLRCATRGAVYHPH